MMSVRRLLTRKKPLVGEWLLDSGGFSELNLCGKYTVSLGDYVRVIERMGPDFAFCQDWMCEEKILRKTGKSVREHQDLTLRSYLALEQEIGEKALPVLQGYDAWDYLRHMENYCAAGVFGKLFGLGSVCGRSRLDEPEKIVGALNNYFPGVRLHGFGLKVTAFKRALLVRGLESADSMAWSYSARKAGEGSNNLEFALEWREKVVGQILETKVNGNVQGKLVYI
jgi:hypothetical protein